MVAGERSHPRGGERGVRRPRLRADVAVGQAVSAQGAEAGPAVWGNHGARIAAGSECRAGAAR
eukprot:3520592-Lingulodinium_polyedra.AAC.1